jgi:arsenite/tail-anchored protein-transporting ATPase
VLAISIDQAHSIGDVLGVSVPPAGGGDPVRVLCDLDAGPTDARGGRLDALALDTLSLLEDQWREIAGQIAGRFPQSDLGGVAPEELSALPGIQEVLGLHAVSKLAQSGAWDRIVVDCASTADALRMLALPSALGLYVERAWPRHRRLSTVVDDRSAAMIELVERIAAAVEELSDLLTDASRVTAHLVLTPERVVVAEAVRTLGSLRLLGISVSEVIVNQVLVQDDSFEYRNLPEHPAFDWYAERIAAQQAALTDFTRMTGDGQLVLLPHRSCEPIGPKALGDLLDCARRRGGVPPGGPLRPVVDQESGSGVGAVYRVRIELPQVDTAALALGRAGDDLIIGVGATRRRVRLASVLRRCLVIGAELKGNELTVRFQPNPEVWPK